MCDSAEAECETILENGQSRVLPSTTRYAARFAACRKRFDALCVGPGAARQVPLTACTMEHGRADISENVSAAACSQRAACGSWHGTYCSCNDVLPGTAQLAWLQGPAYQQPDTLRST